jgi:hypothetical protein
VTLDDVSALSAMGTRFVRLASYGRHMLSSKEEIAIGLRRMLEQGAVGWVAVVDDKIVGALIAALAPVWWSPSILVGAELAWWVEEEHRGGMTAVRLERMFEAWAIAKGAMFAAMSDLVVDGKDTAGPLLERLGYQMVERAHIKKVQ